MRVGGQTPFFALGDTQRGLAFPMGLFHLERMFDRDQFLASVLEKAGTKAAMARALGQPTSRVQELFREPGQRQRALTMEDGVKLAGTFGLAIDELVSAERLRPVLEVCLRYPPKGGWTGQAVERLAQEIEYGLALLRRTSTSQPSPDAIALAANVIADRLRDKPA